MQTGDKPEYHIPIVHWINRFIQFIGHFAAWANVLLVCVILVQVVMRYGFNQGMVYLEELMWHLYAFAFMIGLSYALSNDSHIRVDLIHMRLSRRAQHLWEIFGILVFLMPFIIIIFLHSLDWVADSFAANEASQNPTGLPYRWIIKSVIPISFGLLFLAALSRLIQEITLLFHRSWETDHDEMPERVSLIRHLFSVQNNEQEPNRGN